MARLVPGRPQPRGPCRQRCLAWSADQQRAYGHRPQRYPRFIAIRLREGLTWRWCHRGRRRGVKKMSKRTQRVTAKEPVAELDRPFSSNDATPLPWAEARQQLDRAEVYWLSTVRPDGRPHVTPIVSVWLDDALVFVTGRSERKADNLAQNSHCII